MRPTSGLLRGAAPRRLRAAQRGPRLRDLRQEVDRQATHGQGRTALGLHSGNFEATLEHHLVPTFGKMRLRDITKGAVRHWYDETQDGNTQNLRAISKAYGLCCGPS